MARILLVDDDVHIARVMGIWLTRHGHEIVAVHNGREALSCLQTESIDLIISDMNMPEMDGLALARGVREHGLANLPMLVMTARCDRDSLAASLREFGVTMYPKPFVPSKLMEDVARLLAGTAQPEAVP